MVDKTQQVCSGFAFIELSLTAQNMLLTNVSVLIFKFSKNRVVRKYRAVIQTSQSI